MLIRTRQELRQGHLPVELVLRDRLQVELREKAAEGPRRHPESTQDVGQEEPVSGAGGGNTGVSSYTFTADFTVSV